MRRLRLVFAVVFVVAVTVVAVSAMAFTGRDANATRPSVSPKVRTQAALVEQIRIDRRDSSLRTGCSKGVRRHQTPNV